MLCENCGKELNRRTGCCDRCGTSFTSATKGAAPGQVVGSRVLDTINKPDYGTLLEWWDAWPEARPAHLDFWARGNYTRRLLYRAKVDTSSLLVRVAFLDEMENALKRLALVDNQIDFVWCGKTSGEQLVVVPQDIDYEDSGGWGYDACAGDEIEDRRGGRQWCPSVGWASLLPDSVTDWLSEEARPYVQSGRVMVCPAANIGLTIHPGGAAEENLQRISNGASLLRERAKLQALFRLELPYLEGMSICDIHRFAEDNADSLCLFRSALSKLLKSSINSPETLSRELLSAIEEGVAELRLSERALKARRTLAALGAGIATFFVTVGIHLGVPVAAAAVGSTGAAVAAVNLLAQTVEAESSMRKNPFYAIWVLQRGKRHRKVFLRGQKNRLLSTTGAMRKRGTIPPYHWLSPPSPGWEVPTVIAP